MVLHSGTHADLRTGWKRFAIFSLPLVLGNIVQALSNTFNTIYTGQLLGPTSFAAIAVVAPVLLLFSAFIMGFGNGAAILCARAWGAKDLARVREIAGTTLFAGAALGLAIGAAGQLVVGQVLAWMNTPAEVIAQAISYARVMVAALPLTFTVILALAMLRSTGDSTASLIALAICAIVVLLLTPTLILGLFGLPPIGVASAAWANGCGAALSLGWLAWYLVRRGHPLAPSMELFSLIRPKPAVLWRIFQLGIPTGLFFVISACADVALMRLVNGYGPHATAAWGVVSQLAAYVQFPAASIALAAAVFSAQAIGRGQPDQLRGITRSALNSALLFTLLVAALVAVQSEWLLGIMTADVAVAALAANLLWAALAGSLILSVSAVLTAVMRASGCILWPTITSLSCLAFVLFPLGWALAQTTGVIGIRLAYPLTFALGLALHTAFFHFVWKRRYQQLPGL